MSINDESELRLLISLNQSTCCDVQWYAVVLKLFSLFFFLFFLSCHIFLSICLFVVALLSCQISTAVFMQSFVCLSCLRAPTNHKPNPLSLLCSQRSKIHYIYTYLSTKFLFLRRGAKCADQSPGVHYKHVVFHYV